MRLKGERMLGFTFHEVMEGTLQRDGERFDRPFRFELEIRAPSVVGFLTTVMGEATGRAHVTGLAKDAAASGRMELSPFGKREIRYEFELTGDDGKKYRFDGRKNINWLRALKSWTTLPGLVYDEHNNIYGTAVLRFSMRNHLPGLLKSIRFTRGAHA
jgi:hypothetical protein